MRDWLTFLPYVVRQSWRSPLPVHRGLDFFPSARHTTAPRLIVLHSTETTGFPGYNGGAAAPHFTIDLRSGEVRQHVPLSWGSRCLAVSAGGISDTTVNVTGVIQIETVGAVTPGYPSRYGHYDLPGGFPGDTNAQRNLARLLRAIHDETGIPLVTSSYARWVTYPGSYGARAAQRLNSAQYRDARGVIGHQHAVANDHGDGVYGRAVNGKALDLETTLAIARGATLEPAPVVPPVYENTISPTNNFGFPTAHIRDVQGWVNDLAGLIDLAEPLDVDGSLGPKTMTAVRYLQAALGFPKEGQDGLPGPATTTAIGETMDKLDQILTAQRDLDSTVRAQNTALLGTRFPGAGNARLDDILVATWRKAGTVDPDLLRAALATVPGGQSVDAAALAEAMADELGKRLAGTAKEAK